MSRFYRAMKSTVKPLVPAWLRQNSSKWRIEQFNRSMEGKGTGDVFSAIYEKGMWGGNPTTGENFGSGSGSHDSVIVAPYLEAVTTFLKSFSEKPDVVDLGCGDFSIGSQVRPLCGKYTGGDIVEWIIERNRTTFADLDVEFRVVNIAESELPKGDIVFIRQVLQHLSNENVAKALKKVSTTYGKLVLTEHLPLNRDFEPNIDIPTGPGIRLTKGSGVNITKPPFSTPVKSATVLCDVELEDSRITTTLYEF